MRILIEFDLMLLVTSLGSTLIYGIWKIFSLRAARYSMTIGVYRALQFAILSFFLPLTYLAVCLPHMSFDGSWTGDFLGMTPLIGTLTAGVSVVWLIGALRRLPEILRSIRSEREFRRRHLPCGGREDEIVRELSEQMGIRRRITVHKGDFSVVPALGGVRHPHIYMNEGEESEENLRIIFRHELTHYKHRDVAVKWALNFLSAVYWFHPLFFRGILLEDYTCWSEYACDFCVCRETAYREYGSLLVELAEKASDRMVQLNCMITEKPKETKIRLQRMKRGQKERRLPGALAATLTGVVIFGSSFLAYGAGLGIEAGYNFVYAKTVPESMEQIKKELQEYAMSAEEMASDGCIVEEDGEGVEVEIPEIVMDWEIDANTIKKTKEFEAKEGDEIDIWVDSIEPEAEQIQVGIIEPDGRLNYISTRDGYTFDVNETGNYRVFIFNENSVPIRVTVNYCIISWSEILNKN